VDKSIIGTKNHEDKTPTLRRFAPCPMLRIAYWWICYANA